jgi:glycosyltransferase involved in cell wall biosynthesis
MSLPVDHRGAPGSGGALDGWLLARYTHATPAGGGVERYLGDLDHALLARNRMRILRVGYAAGGDSLPVRTSSGKGELIEIWLPLGGLKADRSLAPVKTILSSLGLMGPARRLALALSQRSAPRPSPGVPPWMCAAGRPDLLAIHCPGAPDGTAPIEGAASMGIPAVLVHHFANHRLAHLAVRRHAAHCRGIGLVSGQGIPPDLAAASTVLGDGIDTDFFSPSRESGVEQAAPPLVLLPARITPGKGHLDLIRAAGMLARQGVSIRLGMPGRREQRSEGLVREMIQLTRAQGLPPLLLPGDLGSGDYRRILAECRLVSLPSMEEGLGRVLLEAQSMGKPVVAYDVGGVRDALIDGATGYLVRRGDVAGLARRIGKLIGDPVSACGMGAAGRRFVIDHFSLGELAERHEAYYRAAAGGS